MVIFLVQRQRQLRPQRRERDGAGLLSEIDAGSAEKRRVHEIMGGGIRWKNHGQAKELPAEHGVELPSR